MVPPPDDGGDQLTDGAPEGVAALQWCRRPMTAETSELRIRATFESPASMVPPPDDGGDARGLGHAGTYHAASMVPPPDDGGDASYRVTSSIVLQALQWCRRPMTAETRRD